MKQFIYLPSFLAVVLSACTSDEPSVSNVFPDDENNTSITVSFEITPDTEIKTRRIEPDKGSNDLLDNIAHNEEDWFGTSFMINIWYKGELVERAQTNFRGSGQRNPVINPNAGIMSDFYLSDGKLTFSGKFNSAWDPSKIFIDFFASPDRSKGINLIMYNLNGYISIPESDLYVGNNECFFYDRYSLSNTNDWNSIRKSFPLTRKNAEIILLVQKDFADEIKEDVIWTSALSLNVEGGVNYIGQKPTSISYVPIGFAPYRYYYNDDKAVYQIVSEIGVQNRYSSGSPDASNYYRKFRFTYKGEEYYMFPPCNAVAGERKSYPLVENVADDIDGTEMKFLTAYVCNYRKVYWTSFPLPEGGIQANKRYIYLVKGNDNFLKDSATRGVYTRSESDVSISDNFQMIEMDMDDPFPIEIVEYI